MSSDDGPRFVPSTETSVDQSNTSDREPCVRAMHERAAANLLAEPVTDRHVRAIEHAPPEPRVVRHVRHALKVPAEPERLPEQARFRERFAFAAARAARTGTKLAVGSIDIGCPEDALRDQRLKAELVRRCAEHLERALRQTDLITFEPDGKMIFLVDDTSARALEALGSRLVRTLSEPIKVGGCAYVPAPAVGMALWSSSDNDADQLLADADWELREVKRRSGKGWRIAGAEQEPIEDESLEPPRPRFRIGAVLQRTVGWVSLLTIGWVVASYSGVEPAKMLVAQLHHFVFSLPHLR
jgi:GGDEF domain-containing protein